MIFIFGLEDVTDAVKVNEIDDVITDKLPDTVRVLTAENGVRVFLVGTAHFSRESQQDVIKVCFVFIVI